MNGVISPSVSAGSSQRETSVTCTPMVIVPSGAASTGATQARTTSVARTAVKGNAMGRRWGISIPPVKIGPEAASIAGAALGVNTNCAGVGPAGAVLARSQIGTVPGGDAVRAAASVV